MDLSVEKNCLKEIKKGNLDKFVSLYDAYFKKVYNYVSRRVEDSKSIDKIVKSVFVDALAKTKEIPEGMAFVVWLYSISKEKVSRYIDKNKLTKDLGIVTQELNEDTASLAEKAKNVFNKLSFEEREILRLKFFEEVSDGDISFILKQGQAAIGPRIFRVLKRAHFLLFGESDERQGIYFGELSGFLSRLKEIEDIKNADVLNIKLRMDLIKKIERNDFAIETEEVSKVEVKVKSSKKKVGSDDPAKIFVQAVKEMTDEERRNFMSRKPIEPKENSNAFNLLSKWRYVFIAIPLLLFVSLFSLVVFKVYDAVTNKACEFEKIYLGDLSEGEVLFVQDEFSQILCEEFEISYLLATKIQGEKLLIRVDLYDQVVKYVLVKKSDKWFIEQYERNTYSNEKSGKVSRNSGGSR